MILKPLKNTKGITLVELLVTMLVFAIIMAAVTSVFAPMLRAFERANNMAEANTLLDNIATLMLYDIAGATYVPEPIDPNVIRITTATHDVEFSLNDGFIERILPTDPAPELLLPMEFYRYPGGMRIYSLEWEHDDGLITFYLTLRMEPDPPTPWRLTRRYQTRPAGLA